MFKLRINYMMTMHVLRPLMKSEFSFDEQKLSPFMSRPQNLTK
jgi:hypothetical protein